MRARRIRTRLPLLVMLVVLLPGPVGAGEEDEDPFAESTELLDGLESRMTLHAPYQMEAIRRKARSSSLQELKEVRDGLQGAIEENREWWVKLQTLRAIRRVVDHSVFHRGALYMLHVYDITERYRRKDADLRAQIWYAERESYGDVGANPSGWSRPQWEAKRRKRVERLEAEIEKNDDEFRYQMERSKERWSGGRSVVDERIDVLGERVVENHRQLDATRDDIEREIALREGLGPDTAEDPPGDAEARPDFAFQPVDRRHVCVAGDPLPVDLWVGGGRPPYELFAHPEGQALQQRQVGRAGMFREYYLFLEPGTRVVHYKIVDRRGREIEDAVTVTVKPRPPDPTSTSPGGTYVPIPPGTYRARFETLAPLCDRTGGGFDLEVEVFADGRLLGRHASSRSWEKEFERVEKDGTRTKVKGRTTRARTARLEGRFDLTDGAASVQVDWSEVWTHTENPPRPGRLVTKGSFRGWQYPSPLHATRFREGLETDRESLGEEGFEAWRPDEMHPAREGHGFVGWFPHGDLQIEFVEIENKGEKWSRMPETWQKVREEAMDRPTTLSLWILQLHELVKPVPPQPPKPPTPPPPPARPAGRSPAAGELVAFGLWPLEDRVVLPPGERTFTVRAVGVRSDNLVRVRHYDRDPDTTWTVPEELEGGHGVWTAPDVGSYRIRVERPRADGGVMSDELTIVVR